MQRKTLINTKFLNSKVCFGGPRSYWNTPKNMNHKKAKQPLTLLIFSRLVLVIQIEIGIIQFSSNIYPTSPSISQDLLDFLCQTDLSQRQQQISEKLNVAVTMTHRTKSHFLWTCTAVNYPLQTDLILSATTTTKKTSQEL